MKPERRKSIRFHAASPIAVQCLDVQTPVTLVDLASGGFSVQSQAELPLGQVMRFRFSTPNGNWATLLSAESVHCRIDPDAPPSVPTFITGFKFVHVEIPRITASINALIDKATAVISFS